MGIVMHQHDRLLATNGKLEASLHDDQVLARAGGARLDELAVLARQPHLVEFSAPVGVEREQRA